MDFKEIINEYCNMIYHISIGYLRNKEDAEDIIQDVLFSYVRHIKEGNTFEDKKHEKYWIIRVTINSCNTKLNNIKKKKKSLDEDSKTYIIKDNALLLEIQKLSASYRDIFILHYLEEYKLNDISEILGISEDTVKTRLKRARQKLKIGLNIEE